MSKESMPDMVTRYHESSLSQKAFAAAHGLTKGKLHYWIKKLARDNNGAGASFVPLEIVCDAPPAPTCILIRCGNGVEIKIPVQVFALSTSDTFHLYIHPTDMRKGFDGLCGLVRNDLEQSPTNGCVYIFINRPRNKVKLLHWQPGGFVLYYKRLEQGTFELPRYDGSVGSLKLDYSQLVLLIDGISITNIVRRKRYKKVAQPWSI